MITAASATFRVTFVVIVEQRLAVCM